MICFCCVLGFEGVKCFKWVFVESLVICVDM